MSALWALTVFKGVRGFSFTPLNATDFEIYLHGSKKRIKPKDGKYDTDIDAEIKSFYRGKLTIRASKMNSIRKGSKEWNDAISAIRSATNDGERFQVRVDSSTEAKEFLEEALGKMDRRKTQTNATSGGTEKYTKGYEQHMEYEGDNLDLPHIKYYINGTDGHIFYKIPN